MLHRLKQEQASFANWIEAHHDGLYRYALWMTGNREVAVDCVQETYYQAWKGRASLKDKDKVFSWLLTILRRTVYREYEQRAANTQFITDSAFLTEQHDERDCSELLDLCKAMSALSTMHRDILLLHSLYGMSYQEISAILQIPSGTVMSRLSRARGALEKILNHEDLSDTTLQIIPFKKSGSYQHE